MKKNFAKKVNISTNNWKLNDVILFETVDGVFKRKKLNNYNIKSIYNYEKITSLFNNSDTMSFLDLILDYKKLMNNGYNKQFLNQSLHSMLSLPFFLFLMTALASIITMGTMKRAENFKLILLGLLVSVLVYYFKDLSIALGKTDRIPLILSIWAQLLR